MAEPIGPGMWVERCGSRNENGNPPPDGRYPAFGVPHLVTGVGLAWSRAVGGLDPSIELRGFDGWWPAACFRPIYRPKSDLIESLTRPIETVDA